jgi:hypothetical protein
MKKIELFIPFSKIDAEKREVWGRITQEAPDKSREIFDYESSVPFFKVWNEEFAARTDGESVGNVREMHQPSAVGKFIDMVYNDDERAIDAGAYISDDAAWQKVVDKVYTGFSIGGGYVKKWKDGDLTRYTAKPSETSLVDNPCLGKATFTQIIKAEGMDEHESTLGSLRKGLMTVADFANVLQSLAWMAQGTEDEAEYEGDDSPIPGAFGDWVTQGLAILQAMTAEEIAELVGTLPKPEPQAALAMVAKGLSSAKKAAMQDHHDQLSALHKAMGDRLDKMAATWQDAPAEEDGAAGKAESAEALQKAAGLMEELAKAHALITELEARPEAAKGVALVFDADKQSEMFHKQAEDAKSADLKKYHEETDEEAKYRLGLKFTHRWGHRPS